MSLLCERESAIPGCEGGLGPRVPAEQSMVEAAPMFEQEPAPQKCHSRLNLGSLIRFRLLGWHIALLTLISNLQIPPNPTKSSFFWKVTFSCRNNIFLCLLHSGLWLAGVSRPETQSLILSMSAFPAASDSHHHRHSDSRCLPCRHLDSMLAYHPIIFCLQIRAKRPKHGSHTGH